MCASCKPSGKRMFFPLGTAGVSIIAHIKSEHSGRSTRLEIPSEIAVLQYSAMFDSRKKNKLEENIYD